MLIPGKFSPTIPDDFGMGVYLAENGVDVWGIDQAWCFPPADASGADFDYFENYGIEKTMRDMRTATNAEQMVWQELLAWINAH